MSESKALKPIDELRQRITQLAPQFKMALPSQVSVDRFTRHALTLIQANESLINVDRTSLYGALMECAQQGLLPDGKEAAIIPFKGRAKFMAMSRGQLKKIRNSGEVKEAAAEAVFQGEVFEHWMTADGTHFKHVPNHVGPKGEMILAYARIVTKDGGLYIAVINAEDAERARQCSQTKDRSDGPWAVWPEEMWKKTAIHRLSKIAPMSTDALQLVQNDEEMYAFQQAKQVVEVKSSEPKKSRLSQIVDEQAPEGLSEMQDAEAAT